MIRRGSPARQCFLPFAQWSIARHAKLHLLLLERRFDPKPGCIVSSETTEDFSLDHCNGHSEEAELKRCEWSCR